MGAVLDIVGYEEYPWPLPSGCQKHSSVITITVSPSIVKYRIPSLGCSRVAPVEKHFHRRCELPGTSVVTLLNSNAQSCGQAIEKTKSKQNFECEKNQRNSNNHLNNGVA